MYKKSYNALAIIFFALFTLTACNVFSNDANSDVLIVELPADDNTTPAETPPTIPIIYVTAKNLNHLNTFSTSHTFDYLYAYAAYHNLPDDDWFFSIEGEWGVVIWAEMPLQNLQIIALSHTDTDSGSYVNAGHVFYELDVLPPGTPFVLSRFVTAGGVLPWEGLSFIDPSGTRRYFAIADDRRGEPGDPPYFLFEFENGGELWGLNTSQTPISLGVDNLYASRINLDGVTARTTNVSAADNTSADALTLVWVVPPTLPHENITLCNCGHFHDQYWYLIDPVTGQHTGEMHLGHGGPQPFWVYDATLSIIGDPGYGGGYRHLYGMHPFDELENALSEWYFNRSRMLMPVALVDSTRRTYWDGNQWYLEQDAYLGYFALMYNYQFTTPFAFHDVRYAHEIVNFEVVCTIPYFAVRVNDLWGAVDKNGNVVIPYMFEDFTFINGNTAFAKYNGAYGILDISGHIGG